MPEKQENANAQLPCKPDESGSPKSLPISTRYLEFARKTLPEKLRIRLDLADDATYGDALAKALFDAAIGGDVQAVREIRESIEGKTSQRRSPKEEPQKFELVVSYEPPPLLAMVPKDNPDVPHE